MRKRGLRRYYRNLNKTDALERIDFSGSPDSWFDLYHLHIDNFGLGNKSWKARKQHLDALFRLADKIEEKLACYPKHFQYWIQIDEMDSSEDAIYVHSENPNSNNFPIKLDIDGQTECKSLTLLDYLKQKNYYMVKIRLSDAKGNESITFFLYKAGLGLEII
ncbi:hypothetical protein D770_05030 [Flammeovirgaceae bacterium 311]|nr:hypothetical protein D770_05030 [Flammeovirgaceae bacterium 311]